MTIESGPHRRTDVDPAARAFADQSAAAMRDTRKPDDRFRDDETGEDTRAELGRLREAEAKRKKRNIAISATLATGLAVTAGVLGLNRVVSGDENDRGPEPAPPAATASDGVEPAEPTAPVGEGEAEPTDSEVEPAPVDTESQETTEDTTEVVPDVIPVKPPHEYTKAELDAMSFEQYRDTYVISADIYDTPEKVVNQAVDNLERYVNLHIDERRVSHLEDGTPIPDVDFWNVLGLSADEIDHVFVDEYLNQTHRDNEILSTMATDVSALEWFNTTNRNAFAIEASAVINGSGTQEERYTVSFDLVPDSIEINRVGPSSNMFAKFEALNFDNTDDIPDAAKYKIYRGLPGKTDRTVGVVFEFDQDADGNWVIASSKLETIEDRSHDDVPNP